MKHLHSLILLVLATLFAVSVQAQEGQVQVSALSAIDRQWLQIQRARIDELARPRLGQQVNGDKVNDLDLLQKLLDQRLVRADETEILQSMGVVLGDLLAAELGMQWVVYEDQLGRSRALQMPGTDYHLFPITMISRRVEAGARVWVLAVYNKAYNLALPYKPALPFTYSE